MKPNHMNSYFEVLLQSVNDAITIVDAEGHVLYWNDSAEQTYGIAREDIVGKRIGEFFRKESVMLYQVMESGNPVRDVYHEPRPGMHVMINANPVFNESNELIGAISIEHNISSYVKLSAELYSKSNGRNPYSIALPFGEDEIGESAAVSKLDYPVMLVGEPGVGKQSLAEWLHQAGQRSGSFVAISCNTIPQGLFDAELFGFHGDAFGEKTAERRGKLDLAADGSVYLKDLHKMPLSTQEKLAQALQERKYLRVGGTTSVALTCRIFASVPTPVENLIEEGLLLSELFYAFQCMRLPSLRERKQDLPELCRLFLAEAGERLSKPVPELSSEAMTALSSYDWPGNLPQLRNVMEHIMIASDGSSIRSEDLPANLRITTLTNLTESSMPLHAQSEEIERSRIADAMERTGGNKARAARLLGISRGALYYKIKQYGLD